MSMTRDELLALPPVLSVEMAARVLDVSLSTARSEIRAGRWPSPVVRVGVQYRVPTAPLLELLGITYTRTTPDEAGQDSAI